MPIVQSIRHWFQKRLAALAGATVASEQRAKYNALMNADPDRLVAAITEFDAGSFSRLARIVEAYELRDDKMKACSMKMKASVARCDYTIMPLEGFEEDERAARHAEVLKRFWSGVRATDAFKRNERGGFALLLKQMMDAQSLGFAVHELVWQPLANGELGCTFIKVPLWHFENHTGELRFLRSATNYEGETMREGEWLVTTGDGVGIAAALCACVKRLSLQDWLVFSERCGMPLLHGTTGAAFGSEQWNNLNAALAAIGRDARILTDANSKVEAIPLGGSAATPFPPLVEWADRAISALYRGADLSTMSRGDDAVGASVQQGETTLIEQDCCNRLSDALHEQIDRFVIRYVCGEEPLAKIWVESASKPDVDTDIKIDSHLAGLGVKLSKADALQRYGRTEAKDENDALKAPQAPMQGGLSGLANERNGKTPLQTRENVFKNAPRKPDGQGEGASENALVEALEGLFETALAEAAARELGREEGKGKREEVGADHRAAREEIANAITNPCPKCGKFSGFNGHCEKCGYTLDADETQKRAERLIEKAMSGTMLKPIDGVAYRDEIGQIDLEVGKKGVGRQQEHGTGLSKLRQKHDRDMHELSATLAHGTVMPTTKGTKVGNPDDPNRRALVHGNYVIFLQRKGDRRWKVSTHYKSANEAAKAEEIKQWLRSGDQSHLQGGAE